MGICMHTILSLTSQIQLTIFYEIMSLWYNHDEQKMDIGIKLHNQSHFSLDKYHFLAKKTIMTLNFTISGQFVPCSQIVTYQEMQPDHIPQDTDPKDSFPQARPCFPKVPPPLQTVLLSRDELFRHTSL